MGKHELLRQYSFTGCIGSVLKHILPAFKQFDPGNKALGRHAVFRQFVNGNFHQTGEIDDPQSAVRTFVKFTMRSCEIRPAFQPVDRPDLPGGIFRSQITQPVLGGYPDPPEPVNMHIQCNIAGQTVGRRPAPDQARHSIITEIGLP